VFRGDVITRTRRDRSFREIRIGGRPTVQSGNLRPTDTEGGHARGYGRWTAAGRHATISGKVAERLVGSGPTDVGSDAAGRHVDRRRGSGSAPCVRSDAR